MFVPLWFLVFTVLLLGANLLLDVIGFVLFVVRDRPHDHLIPDTPRAPRG